VQLSIDNHQSSMLDSSFGAIINDNDKGVFGQFDDNDRIVPGVEWDP